MHQKSSVWVGEYRPSIACVSFNTFSIIDVQLIDCLWFIVGHDDFEIVEFECFQGGEIPEKMPIEKIDTFNRFDPDVKLHELIKWIRVDVPVFLSLEAKLVGDWALVYFDNQLWFRINEKYEDRIKSTCINIFNSMMLPGHLVYDFIWDPENREYELGVADFIAMSEKFVREQLAKLNGNKNWPKMEPYGTKHFEIHPQALMPSESAVTKDELLKCESSVRLMLNCVNSLREGTLLVFVNSDHELMSPTIETMPFAAPYFLKSKESAIMSHMNMFDCEDDLVLVELPPAIGLMALVMVLPPGFVGLEPDERIETTLDLLNRALEMCLSCDQKKIHLLDPSIDLALYEGVFGPKFMNLGLEHVKNHRAQWIFWHCWTVDSYRHYFELRRQLILSHDQWNGKFTHQSSWYPF